MKEGFVFKHDDFLLLKDDRHNLLTVLHENQHGTGANIELDTIKANIKITAGKTMLLPAKGRLIII